MFYLILRTSLEWLFNPPHCNSFITPFVTQWLDTACVQNTYLGTTAVEWSRASVIGTGGPQFEPGGRLSFSEEEFKFDREQLTEIAILNLKLYRYLRAPRNYV